MTIEPFSRLSNGLTPQGPPPSRISRPRPALAVTPRQTSARPTTPRKRQEPKPQEPTGGCAEQWANSSFRLRPHGRASEKCCGRHGGFAFPTARAGETTCHAFSPISSSDDATLRHDVEHRGIPGQSPNAISAGCAAGRAPKSPRYRGPWLMVLLLPLPLPALLRHHWLHITAPHAASVSAVWQRVLGTRLRGSFGDRKQQCRPGDQYDHFHRGSQLARSCRPHSYSASRRAASLAGFFILSQYGDRPET
jgi:hypothetical protein